MNEFEDEQVLEQLEGLHEVLGYLIERMSSCCCTECSCECCTIEEQ